MHYSLKNPQVLQPQSASNSTTNTEHNRLPGYPRRRGPPSHTHRPPPRRLLPSHLFVPETLRLLSPGKPQTQAGDTALIPVLRPSKTSGWAGSPPCLQWTPAASFGARSKQPALTPQRAEPTRQPGVGGPGPARPSGLNWAEETRLTPVVPPELEEPHTAPDPLKPGRQDPLLRHPEEESNRPGQVPELREPEALLGPRTNGTAAPGLRAPELPRY
ncbi:PREDICTED: uncharacterized protein LOC104498363 [Buceros rhinoceros silvestris]|uniref:uncharacterized protein LOC104498363 n=1 Tax=Buceros rhinoceros silvestris TaxID=175836 RepID=UPI000528B191|nr:PREDICTED: uncharacterized protein LOC104498363 [Buceros rhinoceros silvestris]